MSRGRSVSPRAGMPAAIAPLLTSTTWWPAARAAAISPQSLTIAASSSSPDARASDDVPIFTTTITSRAPRPGARRRSPEALAVLEHHVADAHHVAFARAGPLERPFHTHPPEPLVDVGDGLGVGEV